MRVRAISLHQPFASAIALGLKTNETRHWRTKYRGPLAIHAASTTKQRCFFETFISGEMPKIREAFMRAGLSQWKLVPRGQVICLCELYDCVPVESLWHPLHRIERALGDYREGRYAWRLRDVRLPKRQHFVKGRQNFFTLELPEDLF